MGTRVLAGPAVDTKLATLLFVAAILAVLGTSAISPGVGSISYRIATESAPSGSFLAATGGMLEGEANFDGTACFWLQQGVYRTALFWPYRYSARDFPLAVYDAGGARVAEVGRQTSMAGGRAPSDFAILGCAGFTRIWLVGYVVSQN